MSAASDTPPLLELRGVSRHFNLSRSLFQRRTLVAVDTVSLTLRPGDVLGIVGESGCGKTTLSKIMLGLLRPTAGEVRLDGGALAAVSAKAMARHVQFVFQDPYSSLNPRRAIGAAIAQPLAIHGIGTAAERRKRAHELLDLVGLPARLFDSMPGQLSGGQRQRVVIARALALSPKILICDEPTSALDVSVQAQILNLLLDLRQSLGLTYVLVSHNLNVIEHMATDVAVMYLGQIVEQAPAETLFANPRHPYTQALLRSAMTIAPGQGIPDLRLTGAIPNPASPPSGCRFHPRCPEAMPHCATLVPENHATGAGGWARCHLLAAPDAPAGLPVPAMMDVQP